MEILIRRFPILQEENLKAPILVFLVYAYYANRRRRLKAQPIYQKRSSVSMRRGQSVLQEMVQQFSMLKSQTLPTTFKEDYQIVLELRTLVEEELQVSY